MSNTHIAKLMWDAYAIQAGGKTFDEKPLPTWDELGEERQSCWVAAASVAADRIEKLEAALRLIAQNDYGLQGMIEDGIDTPENKAEYYAGQVNRRRYIARKALEGKDD